MLAKFKRQRNKKSREGLVFQIIFLIFTLFFIALLSLSILKINKKRAELSEKIELLKKEVEYLEQEKQKLEAGISQTEKESYWEEKAREQGYVKEGESPVVVLPPSEQIEEKSVAEQSFLEGLAEKIKSLFARVIQW